MVSTNILNVKLRFTFLVKRMICTDTKGSDQRFMDEFYVLRNENTLNYIHSTAFDFSKCIVKSTVSLIA